MKRVPRSLAQAVVVLVGEVVVAVAAPEAVSAIAGSL
jgi:hypothetical protein